MITYSVIRDIKYYTGSSRKPDTRLGYYADACGEPPGVWWSPGNFQGVDGSAVEPVALERLASYRDTKTGRTLPGQRAADARAGTDFTFSAPKAFSALWAVSDDADRARLENLFMDSVRASLSAIHGQGLIEARRGKGGAHREPVAAPVAAIFLHHTSREYDPQSHAHALMMNTALRSDGTIGAINCEEILKNRQLLDALFTRDLAHRLEKLGVRVEASPEHGFKIVGQPENLIETWSKRRKVIVEKAHEIGIETKENAKLSQVITKKTRKAKSNLQTIANLETVWEIEWVTNRNNSAWADLNKKSILRSEAENENGEKKAMVNALNELSKNKSWWTDKQLMVAVIRHGIGLTNGGHERLMMHHLINSGELVRSVVDDKILITSKAILAKEKRIIEIVKKRRREKRFFSDDAGKAALSDPNLSGEQRNAILAALGGDGIVAIMGGAGVGKTVAASGIKRACAVDGKDLILASPEWRAAGVLAAELESEGKYSVDRIIIQIKSGKLALHNNSVVLIDEAGKMHRDQAYELFELTKNTGAKIILVGDTRQMSAVRAGDPLDLVAKANPAAEIRAIRRQKIDWMREASMNAQAGAMDKMLAAYGEHGKIAIADKKADCVREVAAAWKKADGDAVALAATNSDVTAINAAIRGVARETGKITGPDIEMSTIPRGKEAKPVMLKIATGDRLICGSALDIGGQTIENGTIFAKVEISQNQIKLTADDGRLFETTLEQLSRSGARGKPPSIQHAYCLTDMSSQGSTWTRTLWMPTAESRRAAYVAATRHREDLQIFIAREAVKGFPDAEMKIGRAGLIEAEARDLRSRDEIVAHLAKALARADEPRNALDAMGISMDGIAPEPGIGNERSTIPVGSQIIYKSALEIRNGRTQQEINENPSSDQNHQSWHKIKNSIDGGSQINKNNIMANMKNDRMKIHFNAQFLRLLDHVRYRIERGDYRNEDMEKFVAKTLNMFKNDKEICDKALKIKELYAQSMRQKLRH